MTRDIASSEAARIEAARIEAANIEAGGPDTKRSAPPLPPCAAKADDLEAIRKSVEDAAAVSGALWISYLFVIFYLAVAAGAVTHVDLFLENAVKLPFLSIELPIKAFFLLAPLILLVTHIYTLTSFVLLSEKAQVYHGELKRQIAGDGDPDSAASREAAAVRDRLRRQLPSNIFVQFLAGPDDVRSGLMGLVLKTIAWVTLAIAPPLVLLLMQLQFLAYHSPWVTWTTRLALVFDFIAILWLWQAILLGRGESRRPSGWLSIAGMALLYSLMLIAGIFSWTVATFPGEPLENKLFSWRFLPGPDDEEKWVSLHDYLFKGPIDSVTRRRGFFFSSTLILPVFDIFEQKNDDEKKYGPFKYIFHARGRDFRGADFDLSNLSNVDFEGSHLEGASFDRARLHNASLFCARLDEAKLSNAELQGAWFFGTVVRGATLDNATGEGAMFDGAEMQGANLQNASFKAASFQSADLADARLAGAHLEATSFRAKKGLEASCIDAARAKGGAHLENAVLTGASFAGATFSGVQLTGVKNRPALLADSDLIEALTGQNAQLSQGRRASLAKTLRGFVCSGDPNAIYVLRGLFSTDRIADAGPDILPLLDEIKAKSPKCPLEALSVFDEMNLLKLREALRLPQDHKK